MFRSIWSDLRQALATRNPITQLIVINSVVYVLFGLVTIILFLVNGANPDPQTREVLQRWLGFPANWKTLLFRPWTPLTSIFFHADFFHILWNMLYLYWFGRILADLLGNNRIWPIYVYGGLAGGFFFFIFENLSGTGNSESFAIGASGAVTALIAASMIIAPNYRVHLLFVGPVKLMYLGLIVIFLDLLVISTGGANAGGSAAHIGGAVFGFGFSWLLKTGRADLSLGFNRAVTRFQRWLDRGNQRRSKFEYIKNPNPPRSKAYTPKPGTESRKAGSYQSDSGSHKPSQEVVDAILDKIREKGYSSLTTEEKETLFRASD